MFINAMLFSYSMTETVDEEIDEATSKKCSLENVIAVLEPEFYQALSILGVQFTKPEDSIDITNIDVHGSARYNAAAEKYQQDPGAFIEQLRNAVLYCWIKRNINENIFDKGHLLSIDSHLGLIDRLLWLSSELNFEEKSAITAQDQKVVIYELVTDIGEKVFESNIAAPPKSAYQSALKEFDAETWNFVVAMMYINDINRKAFALGYAHGDIIVIDGHDPLGFPNKIKFKPQNVYQNVDLREDACKIVVEQLNHYMQ